jgi:hypothetical protein
MPIYKFNSANEAEKTLNISGINECIKHDIWHVGTLNGKYLRWEYEDIHKRSSQKERKSLKKAGSKGNKIYHIDNDGNKIEFNTIVSAAKATCGVFAVRTQANSISESIQNNQKCKCGHIWFNI